MTITTIIIIMTAFEINSEAVSGCLAGCVVLDLVANFKCVKCKGYLTHIFAPANGQSIERGLYMSIYVRTRSEVDVPIVGHAWV